MFSYKEINNNKCMTCNNKITIEAKYNLDRCWTCIDTLYIKDLEELKTIEHKKTQKLIDELNQKKVNIAYYDYQTYLKNENKKGLEWLNRDKNWKDNDDNDITQFDYEWNTFNWND